MNAPLPDYSRYSVNEFVLDDSFRQWILQPNEQSMTFWHGYMLNHPEQQAIVDEAASLLLHLNTRFHDLTEVSQERIWQVLDRAFDERQTHETVVRPLPVWQRVIDLRADRGWQVAASLAGFLLLAGAILYYWQLPKEQHIHTAFGENRTITLPDGSTVLLNGNTTLTYTDGWTDDKSREVWLDGEGFFTVTKKNTWAAA